MTSFRPQRHEWIDASGATCRHVGGEHRWGERSIFHQSRQGNDRTPGHRHRDGSHVKESAMPQSEVRRTMRPRMGRSGKPLPEGMSRIIIKLRDSVELPYEDGAERHLPPDEAASPSCWAVLGRNGITARAPALRDRQGRPRPRAGRGRWSGYPDDGRVL